MKSHKPYIVALSVIGVLLLAGFFIALDQIARRADKERDAEKTVSKP
jgi:hypothetical protein